MKIISAVLGELQTNCYLLFDEQSGLAAVIDPADNEEVIGELLAREGATLAYILLTHGHRDHTLAAPGLHRMFPEAKVYIHPDDKMGAGIYHFPPCELIPEILYYREGDVLPLGALRIEVLETPGHTAGSVTLRCGNALFTGDTLFAGSCGRIDLPGAVPQLMLPSLRRLALLEGDYDVYPGHMEETTLARERRVNPYIRQALREA